MDLLILFAGLLVALLAVYFYVSMGDKPKAELATKTETETPNTTPIINAKSGDAVTAANVLDFNKDGKVDVKDAVEVVKKTRTRIKKTLDKDGDGKVTLKDVKAATKKPAAKKTASAKNPTSPKRTRKPKAV